MTELTYTGDAPFRAPRDDISADPGETVVVDDDDLATWLVETHDFVRGDVDTDDTEQPSLEAALDGTVDGLEGDLASGEYDDRLDELEAVEQDGQDRAGAHEAIADRRAEHADEE